MSDDHAPNEYGPMIVLLAVLLIILAVTLKHVGVLGGAGELWRSFP